MKSTPTDQLESEISTLPYWSTSRGTLATWSGEAVNKGRWQHPI